MPIIKPHKGIETNNDFILDECLKFISLRARASLHTFLLYYVLDIKPLLCTRYKSTRDIYMQVILFCLGYQRKSEKFMMNKTMVGKICTFSLID